jgi:hypothetical protein
VAWLRRHYGAGPLHLVGLLVCFGIAAYAVTRVLGESGRKAVLLWFVACVLVHDVIGWPIYTAADRILVRAQRRPTRSPGTSPPGTDVLSAYSGRRSRPLVPWANHVRFPTVISAVLFGISFPLIFRISNAYYVGVTGFDEDVYLTNWLAVTGILFAASAFTYLLRLGLALRRTRRRTDAPAN